MRITETILWAVYQMTIHGKASGMSAVCEQGEWEAMERDRPGYHTLIRGGIANEGEAERLARSSSGYDNTSKASALKRAAAAKRAVARLAGTTDPVVGDAESVVLQDAAVVV
jgi:hypothetical protein